MPKKPGSRWSRMTPLLAFSCFCLVVGDLLFGYDVGNFGGILGNPVSSLVVHLLLRV
jgi:hypothetical protein